MFSVYMPVERVATTIADSYISASASSAGAAAEM